MESNHTEPQIIPAKDPGQDRRERSWAATGCPVIVPTADGKVFACSYQWTCTQNGIGTFYYGRSDNEIKNVVAWMPIPEPYQPKGKTAASE